MGLIVHMVGLVSVHWGPPQVRLMAYRIKSYQTCAVLGRMFRSDWTVKQSPCGFILAPSIPCWGLFPRARRLSSIFESLSPPDTRPVNSLGFVGFCLVFHIMIFLTRLSSDFWRSPMQAILAGPPVGFQTASFVENLYFCLKGSRGYVTPLTFLVCPVCLIPYVGLLLWSSA